MTNEQIIKKLLELEKEIQTLKEWKFLRQQSQLTLPLDQTSKEIINNYTNT